MPIIHARQALTPSGWQTDIAVQIGRDGKIDRITPIDQTATRAPDHAVDLLLPAPVNLHSHSFQRAMSGLSERPGRNGQDSFWTWRQLMYRFLDQLTPDMVQAIAELAFMEMAEAGYAAVAEFHYLHHAFAGVAYDDRAEMARRIIAAAGTTGLGLTLLPVLYQQGGCDGRALEGGQTRFGNSADAFADLWQATEAHMSALPGDAALGWAPHSLRAVNVEDLRRISAAIGHGPVHIHAAEQVAEVEEVLAHLGARPVDWLLDEMGVNDNWCLIHATQMTDTETSRLAASGAVAGLCPITEASLGDGIFNGARFAQAGGRYAVGTDSNIQISLWGELRALEYSQRLRIRARAVMAKDNRSTGRSLFEAACKGGAQAAGRSSGTIAPGQWADLLACETDNHVLGNLRGDTVLDRLIFGASDFGSIRDVWSAGRHIVHSGKHVDRARIVGQYMSVQQKLEEGL